MDEQPVVPMPTGLSQQENIANEQESLSQDPGQAGGQIEDNILPASPRTPVSTAPKTVQAVRYNAPSAHYGATGLAPNSQKRP